jgi:hypothetical protein
MMDKCVVLNKQPLYQLVCLIQKKKESVMTLFI